VANPVVCSDVIRKEVRYLLETGSLQSPREHLLSIERFLESIEKKYRTHEERSPILQICYIDSTTKSKIDVPLLMLEKLQYEGEYKPWEMVLINSKVKPSQSFLKALVLYSKTLVLGKFNIFEEFLDSFLVNEDLMAHKFLSGRARTECLINGSIPLYKWFAFFSSVIDRSDIILRSIAGIISKYPVPFLMSSDSRTIDQVFGFYNIPNILECLHNALLLKYSLNRKVVEIMGNEIYLEKLIDELALCIAISPKKRVKDLRTELNSIFGYAGIECDDEEIGVYSHDGWDPLGRKAHNKLKLIRTKNTMRAFKETKHYTKMRIDIFEKFDSYSLKYLKEVCSIILKYNPLKDTKFESSGFTITLGVILNIVSIAGFGRSDKYKSASRSKEDNVKDKSVGDDLENRVLTLHELAIQNNILPLSPSDWVANCIGLWKNTSSGIGKRTLKYKNENGEELDVDVANKPLVGLVEGTSTFKRKMISEKLTIDNPGKVGGRDVPYKASRLIYVVPMQRNHCQAIFIDHLQRYLSSGQGLAPVADDVTAANFTVGKEVNMGKKAFDDVNVIATSGAIGYLEIGLDYSSFDGSQVPSNFRIPIINAFKKIFLAPEYEGKVFGPDKITYEEMLNYAFGDGYITNTFWDVDRQVLIKSEIPRKGFEKVYVKNPIQRKDSVNNVLKVRINLKVLDEGFHYLAISDEDPDVLEAVYKGEVQLCCRADGADLFKLTTLASGELGTLLLNSIACENMAARIIKHIKSLSIGSKLRPVTKECVGDDTRLVFRIVGDITSNDVDDMLESLFIYCENSGYTISIPKVQIRPFKSEYIQTYASHGLLIPRDHIMVISSEKVRKLDDMDSYLSSRKRFYCTKIARGSNPFAMSLLFYFEASHVSKMKLKFSDLTIGSWQKIKMRDAYSKLQEERSIKKCLLTTKNSDSKMTIFKKDYLDPKHQKILEQEKRKKNKTLSDLCGETNYSVLRRKITVKGSLERIRRGYVWSIRRSIQSLLLPIDASGHGVCCWYFPILVTPASFIYEYISAQSLLSISERKYMVTLLSVGIGLNLKMGVDNKLEKYKLSPGQINREFFLKSLVAPELYNALPALKSLDLGRLNFENAISRMEESFVMTERSMRHEIPSLIESSVIKFIERIMESELELEVLNDEWVLGLDITYQDIPFARSKEIPSSLLFLDPITMMLIDHYGMLEVDTRENLSRNRVRMIISREPLLRNNISPEEVIRVLFSFGCLTMNEHEKAHIILMRIGFSNDNAQTLFENIIKEKDYLITTESIGGAWSDDLLGLINIVNSSRLRNPEISFVGGMRSVDKLMQFMAYAFFSFVQVKKLLLEGMVCKEVTITNAKSEMRRIEINRDLEKLGTLGHTVTFPTFFRLLNRAGKSPPMALLLPTLIRELA
jgi:hypothetical protein